MSRLFLTLVFLLVGCGEPWIALPPPGPDPLPANTHLCIGFTVDPSKFLEGLCLSYPFAWEDGCEANEDLQSCTEFVTALMMECPLLSSCDYEECSKALQLGTCGDWPEACELVVSCVAPPWTPPLPAPPEPTGGLESTGMGASETGTTTGVTE